MFRRLVVPLVAVTLLGGCAPSTPSQTPQPSPTPSASQPVTTVGDFSIGGRLALVPLPGADSYTVTVGDFAHASMLAGLEFPAHGDIDGLVDWAVQTSGTVADGPAVSLLLPEAMSPSRIMEHDAVEEEYGFSLWRATDFIELSLPPTRFTVLGGDVDTAALDAALGPADEGMWSIGGDDFSLDLEDRTTARPLGRGMRIAEVDGAAFMISTSTPLVRAMLDGTVGTLADDPEIAALAATLDAQGVYSAWIARNDFGGVALGLPAAFETLAIGLAEVDGAPVLVAAYAHANEVDAAASAEVLADVLASSSPGVKSRLVGVSTTTDGAVLTAVFSLAEVPLAAVWGMPLNREPVFAHR